MWPVTQDRNEVQGIYDVTVTTSRPRARLPRTKGVARERSHGTRRVKATGPDEACDKVLARLRHILPSSDVVVRYGDTRRQYYHPIP